VAPASVSAAKACAPSPFEASTARELSATAGIRGGWATP
jgi:hypothetical protein